MNMSCNTEAGLAPSLHGYHGDGNKQESSGDWLGTLPLVSGWGTFSHKYRHIESNNYHEYPDILAGHGFTGTHPGIGYIRIIKTLH